MSIRITSHKESYSCQGCTFYAKENELIVTAEYWEDLEAATNKMWMEGWNSGSIYQFTDSSEKAIKEAISQEYGEEVAKTGLRLLATPQLVMLFTLF